MSTYRATIRGHHIEWQGRAPGCLDNGPVEVDVTVVRDPVEEADPQRGQKMAAILEKIAARGKLAAIEDPAEWQRDARRDRPLPGRGD